MASHRKQALWLGAAVVVATAFVYRDVVGFGFVNLDDRSYVYANPMVLAGLTLRGVAWAFTTFHAANWHPLTWLSHMLDVSLFGPSPGAMHVVSAALHVGNALLLMTFLLRATRAIWPSVAVAALFAVHPLAVESVAWISERKTVLSTLFLLVALHAWVAYARRAGVTRYGAALAVGAAGRLAKPMVVTLPFILLLVDAWPLGRFGPAAPAESLRRISIRRAVAEKVPFLALSAAICVTTVAAQRGGGAVQDLTALPWSARLANAVVSYVAYLVQAVWPAGLAAFYPHPAIVEGGVPPGPAIGAAVVLVVVSLLAFRAPKARPWLAFGWAWYLGTLVPVIGLVQVGTQAQADRYTYVPLIGIFVAVAWSAAEWLRSARPGVRLAMGTVAGLALIALCGLASAQVSTWRDSEALHRHALAVTARNYKAWAGLGETLLEQGRLDDAIAASLEALRYVPAVPEASNTLGVAYGRLGRHQLALSAFEDAVRASPTFAEGWYNLGTAYGMLGDHRRAADCFRASLQVDPRQARAWANLAVAYSALGEPDHARDALRRLAPLDPSGADRLRAELGLP